jgi:hypothetical protein
MDAEQFVVEQVTGLFETTDPDRPPAGYATRELSSGEVEVVVRERAVGGDSRLGVLEMRFRKMADKGSMLCRVTPIAGGQPARASEVFPVYAERHSPLPWRTLLMFALAGLLLFLLFEFAKRRRA